MNWWLWAASVAVAFVLAVAVHWVADVLRRRRAR
jgi:hypothetical protein